MEIIKFKNCIIYSSIDKNATKKIEKEIRKKIKKHIIELKGLYTTNDLKTLYPIWIKQISKETCLKFDEFLKFEEK